MITRDEARRLAEDFLRARGSLPGWEGVERVLSPEELANAWRPPGLDLPARFRDCWAVFFRGTAGGAVYLSATTGKIQFAGAVQGEPRASSG